MAEKKKETSYFEAIRNNYCHHNYKTYVLKLQAQAFIGSNLWLDYLAVTYLKPYIEPNNKTILNDPLGTKSEE